MSRIIQIDSNFINKVIYPLDTDFIIPVNATPPVSTSVPDSRSVYYAYNYIYSRYIWIGNTTLSEYSDVSNNAIQLFFFPLDGTHVFVFFQDIPAPPGVAAVYSYNRYVTEIQKDNDYFVGCLFIYESFSSLISEFSGTSGIITLTNPIPFDTTVTSSCYIFNPSFTYKNTFTFLGSNRFQKQTASEFLLYTGLNLSDVIIHVKTYDSYDIKNFIQQSRSMILVRDISDYLSNDLFLVRPLAIGNNKNSIRIVEFTNPLPQFKNNGIMTHTIVNPGTGYVAGDVLTVHGTEEASFRVIEVDRFNGGILTLLLTYPGSGFQNGGYALVGGGGNGAMILVREVFPYFIIQNFEGFYITENQYLLIFPDFKIWSLLPYFLFVKKHGRFIYFEAALPDVEELNNGDNYYNETGAAGIVEFIPYFTLFPSINLPIVQYSARCFEVAISTISLPNLPVCGYNLLLADFPYLLVTITNATNMDVGITSGGLNYGSIFSNNPNLIRSTFVCPIANIKNPDIIKFVVVDSNQKMILKINPSDALRFTVQLPNGRVLTFVREDGCALAPRPLNQVESSNSKRVYALDFKRQQVSVTFTITPV